MIIIQYLIYCSELTTSDNTTTATFADDTAAFVTLEETATVSMKLQATVNKIYDWEKKRRIKMCQSKSTHITFTLHAQTCPAV
jgi:hypothetical protein